MNLIQKRSSRSKFRWLVASGALLLIIGMLAVFNGAPFRSESGFHEPQRQPEGTSSSQPGLPVVSDRPASAAARVAPEKLSRQPIEILREKSELWRTRNAAIMRGGEMVLDSIGSHDAPIEDLKTVRGILENYLITLKTDRGLPTGTHQEIVAALRGNNARQLEFIPPSHERYDSEGRITDRWNTPFFFHARSSLDLQIVSAGADREFWTDDDLVYPPVSRADRK